MGTIPTIAESRAALVSRDSFSPSTVQYTNSDSNNALIEEYSFKVPATLTTPLTNGAVKGKKRVYLSFTTFVVADWANCSIGDEVHVLLIDSSVSTSAISDAQKWLRTAAGWVRTDNRPKKRTPIALADADATPTGAQIISAEIFTLAASTARNFTLPAATDIFAALTGAEIGSVIEVTVVNNAAATNVITVVCPASITNKGIAGHLAVAAATAKTYKIVFTSSTAADLYLS